MYRLSGLATLHHAYVQQTCYISPCKGSAGLLHITPYCTGSTDLLMSKFSGLVTYHHIQVQQMLNISPCTVSAELVHFTVYRGTEELPHLNHGHVQQTCYFSSYIGSADLLHFTMKKKQTLATWQFLLATPWYFYCVCGLLRRWCWQISLSLERNFFLLSFLLKNLTLHNFFLKKTLKSPVTPNWSSFSKTVSKGAK
jgi:hypothetical protein